jgi:hypothetical protein
MRNPSHQLNDDDGANDVPLRGAAGERGISRFDGASMLSILAKCLGIARENCLTEPKSLE